MKFNKPSTAVRILMLVILTVSIASAGFGLSSNGRSIQTTGLIVSTPTMKATVNPSRQIGTNTLSLGFMLDHDWKWWRDTLALRELAHDANFKLVRLFDWRANDYSPDPVLYWNESTEKGTFDWTNVDAVVRGIFDSGAEPLICLGYYGDSGAANYFPAGMTINYDTGLPSPSSFASYVGEWVEHFKQRGFPVRYYEILNEPAHYYGWGGSNTTRLSYFTNLFNACYEKIHQINPNTFVGTDSSNFKNVLNFFANNAVGLDFISLVHTYTSETITDGDSTVLQKAEQLGFQDSSNIYGASHARQIWYNARGITLPILISETNFSWAWENGTDPRIQQLAGTVGLALQIRMSILSNVERLLYFRFSSSKNQERKLQTGGYGFGMINSDDNQPWYPYYLMSIIGNNLSSGDVLLETRSDSEDMRTLAWLNGGKLNILLICKVDEPRTIQLEGIQGELSFTKIDETVSWETPKLQSGKLAATAPLAIRGYTVLLLQKSV